MGGGEPPMNGDDDPMGGEDSPMGGSDDDELMSIVDGMSTEDKAAVIKYAKSMADDSEGSEDPMGGEIPMESRHSFRNIIDETINDVLDSKEGTKRHEKKQIVHGLQMDDGRFVLHHLPFVIYFRKCPECDGQDRPYRDDDG